MRAHRYLVLLLLPVLAWISALVQRAQPLNWDEIEFFRATRWVSEGLIPYRDFWEHHTPLQWFVFAPVAGLFGGGAGVGAVLAMRWAQLPLWIGACVLLFSLMRRGGVDAASRWLALLLLLTSRSFVIWAVQYRVDALGNVLFLCGLALMVSRRWITFGVVMSAAALANMRLAPLIVLAALLAAFWSSEEERWRWTPRALSMAIGVVATAGVAIAYLVLTGAWAGFIEGIVGYNSFFNRVTAAQAPNMLLPVLLSPFRLSDVSGIALSLLAIAGTVLALRDVRRPFSQIVALPQIVALLFVAALVSLAVASPVQYDYHLQTAWLLMVPLAGLAFTRLLASQPRFGWLAFATIAVALALNLLDLVNPAFGKGLDYQDLVMKEADRRTAPEAAVWDGTGYALRRRPAYRYWFLPVGVRMMAQQGVIAPYDPRGNPPAAIVYDQRVQRWLEAFPNVGSYTARHYLPLYRNLLLPGMSTAVEARPLRSVWRVPVTATYDLWAGELATQPELARLLGSGDGYVDLDRLPRFPYESLQVIVDGVALPRGTRVLTLKKGARVELVSSVPRPAGILFVLHGIRTLGTAPDTPFAF